MTGNLAPFFLPCPLPLLARDDLLHLALDHRVVLAGFFLPESFLELAQVRTGDLGLVAVGLGFADLANGALHLFVGAVEDLLRLLFGLFQNALFQCFDLAQLLLVLVGQALERLVGGLDAGQLLVEDAAAAGDLAQIALDVDEFAARPLFGVLDHLGRQAHLARQFESEGIARHALLQLEERLDGGTVEEHRAVHHAGTLVGVKFQVRVVRGDHAVGAHLVEAREHGFGDGAAGCRLGAAAEFVDQHERRGGGVREDLPHVLKVGAVGTQVVLQRLVVADVDEDAVEDQHLAHFGRGDEHTPLEHILEQTYGLEAH